MKGIGKIKGWRVHWRSARDIVWKNLRTNREIAIWEACDGKNIVYEVAWDFPGGKLSLFKDLDYALKRIKNTMLKSI